MIALAWGVLWLPFLAAVGIFFFGLNRPKLAGWLATGALFASFVLSLILLLRYGIPMSPVQSSIRWVALPALTVEFGILLNGLTLLMLLIVTGVGSAIFLYSQEYMERDEGYARYFACLSFFAFSMLGIVLANNFIEIFIFWELVGLSSYLLIGHWFEKSEASDAGKKAFLTTRVGDVGFLLGILLLFGWLEAGGSGTFNFLVIEDLLKGIQLAGGDGQAAFVLTLGGLLVFLGVIGKSAQFPLHVWLPDAMEGPTPVSALIHAATMVAAGVFLLARLFFLFSASSLVLSVILGIGALTAFFSATIAVVQNDIKRILAYSTLSQLGFMVASLGLGNPQAGMFHLGTHAFFKALLFLCAGSVIHTLHTQDIWKMSGLLRKMPVTGWTFLAGTLALVGIFPTSGFWSKEEILASAYQGSPTVFILLLLTSLFTALYMGRAFAVVFLRKSEDGKKEKDPTWIMTGPLLVLALFSLGGGFLPLKAFVPLEQEFHAPFFVKIIGLSVGIVGFVVTVSLYTWKPALVARISESVSGFRRVLENKYYFDELYNALIRHVQDRFASLCNRFEKVVVVGFYVNGTARLTRYTGHLVRQLQTGRIQFYALLFSLGVTLLTYGLILWKR
jgi:NADH-quinone oxidoreductase subunit L